MKIAVLGANGRSGQVFVRAALAAGHTVRAGVHSNNPFSPQKGLKVMQCDALRGADIERLITSQDAVVSLIGHTRQSHSDLQLQVMQKLLEAMRQQQATRLICLTGNGVRFAGDQVTIVDRMMNYAVARVDPARIQDGRNFVRILQQSSLNWTVIRVLKLTGGRTQPFALTVHGPAKTFVSRETVAQAILQELAHNAFRRRAPIISKSQH